MKTCIHKCPCEGEQNRKQDVKFADRVRNIHTGEDRQGRNSEEREREKEKEREPSNGLFELITRV